MLMRSGRNVLALSSLVIACNVPGGGHLTAQKVEGADVPRPPSPVTAVQPKRMDIAPPQLVVALIYDQLGSDTLLEHLPFLDPAGAIARAVRAGAFFERSVYPYANTLTAPGHAAIHTGAAPNESGIEGNSTWSVERQRAMAVIEDPRHLVFGREKEGVSAGPVRLLAPTVAEVLESHTGGVAKVVSLSLKDRSAILSVGSSADLVLWYDAKLGGFTSSSAWGSALPEWLRQYQEAHPLAALLTPWVALSPGEYLARLGPDAAPGEGDLGGLGTTFPHGWERVSAPLSVLGCTPMMSEYLVALASAAVDAEELGRDAVPDLLALSISGTDCAGHVFGPDSWEYVDHLVRADRAAGAWLARLEQRTSLAVVITSDHGVAPLPESQARAGRIFPERIRERVEAALARGFGQGPWLAGVLTPYVYLSPQARAHGDAQRLVDAAIAALRKETGVRDAWALREVRGWASDPDPLRQSLLASVAAHSSADLVFLTSPHYPLDLRDPFGKGTNHGTPYDYDRQVPVLAFGPVVPRLRRSEPVDQLRVAATLSKLMGIPAPARARGAPLF
jgi:GNAT superfamily N-acetyltransferase